MHFMSTIDTSRSRARRIQLIILNFIKNFFVFLFLPMLIDKANSKFDFKIKEALHVNWRKPNLNEKQNHLALTLSL